MIKTKEIQKVEIELKVISANCDFCKKEFDERTIECNGYGQLSVSFAFGSCFDDDSFRLEICDNCFIEKFGSLVEKQLKEKQFYSLKEMKEFLKEKNNVSK